MSEDAGCCTTCWRPWEPSGPGVSVTTLRADLERVTREREVADNLLMDAGAENSALRADRDRLSGEVERLTRELAAGVDYHEDCARLIEGALGRAALDDFAGSRFERLAASIVAILSVLDAAKGKATALTVRLDEERAQNIFFSDTVLQRDVDAKDLRAALDTARGEVAALTAERDALLARLPPTEVRPVLATDLDCHVCGAASGQPCTQVTASVLPGGIAQGAVRRMPHPQRLGDLRRAALGTTETP